MSCKLENDRPSQSFTHIWQKQNEPFSTVILNWKQTIEIVEIRYGCCQNKQMNWIYVENDRIYLVLNQFN